MGDELNFKINSEIYPIEKEKANKETVWEHYFARKIAFLIAPTLLKLGVSANQASFSSMTLGIIGAVLIAIGNFWAILLGAILMQLWLILDKTDGVIARFRKVANKFGEFFEELNGALMAVLFFSSIGFASSRLPGSLPAFVYFPPKIFIILGLTTSLFVVFRHLISRHFEVVFWQNKEVDLSFPSSGRLASLYKILVKFSGVYSLAQPIFILALIFNFLGLYTFVYFVLQGALMLASVAKLIYRASKI